MSKNTIHEDSHGIYVKTNGGIFRPQKAERVMLMRDGVGTSVFKKGQKVNARYSTGAHGWCSVKSDGVKEIWYCHGNYILVRQGTVENVDSEECWRPLPTIRPFRSESCNS